MKYTLWLIRIVVGVLFIFSGLIKANDPLGLSYKMDEFFEVWGMHWAMSYSLAMSVLMIAFEIIAGVAVLLGYAYRVFSFLLLALIAFFTFLTAYVLFSGKIKECGCFGDCVKISNEETFWKDVILLVLGIVLVIFRDRIQPVFGNKTGTSLMVIVAVFAFGFQWYRLMHLPYYDCLPYKTGVNIIEDRKIPPGAIPDQYESIMIYKKDGVEKEFTMENYPWQDTTWVFVDRKDKLIKKGNAEPKIKDFIITDYDGNDYTESILNTPGNSFFLFVRDSKEFPPKNMDKLKALMEACQANGTPFYILCSDNKDQAFAMRDKYDLRGEMVVLDRTVSKTAMRTDGGLMLIEQGVIKNKWAPADYPGVDVVKK